MNEMKIRTILLDLLRSSDVSFTSALRECSGEDWEQLVRETNTHGITPLFYKSVQTSGISVPEEARKKMHAAYLRAAEQNIRRYHCLGKVFAVCDGAGIPVIPLKGMYLAQHVYQDIALREMSDVDVLVRKKDLDAFESILAASGFMPMQQNKIPFLERGRHLRYVIDESGLLVEVHWDLMDPGDDVQIDIEALWERSKPLGYPGGCIRALSPEDLLLHLCVHLANHTFCLGLRGLYDLAMTVHVFMNVMDWNKLYDIAVTWNAVRALYVNLQLIAGLLDVQVSKEYLERVKPRDFEEQYMEISRELVFASYEPNNPVFSIMSEEDGGQKAGFMLKALFPSPRTIALKYPSVKNRFQVLLSYPLYYKDRMKKYWDVAWLLFLGSRQTVAEKEQHRKIKEVKKWLLSG